MTPASIAAASSRRVAEPRGAYFHCTRLGTRRMDKDACEEGLQS
jgi:hypothetical protein